MKKHKLHEKKKNSYFQPWRKVNVTKKLKNTGKGARVAYEAHAQTWSAPNLQPCIDSKLLHVEAKETLGMAVSECHTHNLIYKCMARR